MRWLLLATAMLAACDAGARQGPDRSELLDASRPLDRDAQPGDPPPGCRAPSAIEVVQDGEALETASEEVTATWSALGARELFRLRIATHHDPIPQAIDDEFTFVAAIDLVPSELLRLSGQPLPIDQQVETAPLGAATSHENDPRVAVTSRGEHAPAIRRVLVERQAFGTANAAARYEVTGELSIRLTSARRAVGTVSLRLLFDWWHRTGASRQGDVDADTELRIDGCFDVDASRPLACVPGVPCAVDCIGAEEWVCGDCGQLYFTHDCGCLPDLAPLAGCEDEAPANAGEPCGEEWWCDRPCAAGLSCTPDPSYRADSDAGAGSDCHYRSCQPR